MQEKLIILRERKKLSKTFVAKFLGISLNQYSAKERGRYEFTQDEMFLLRDLFDASLESIFSPRSHQFGDK